MMRRDHLLRLFPRAWRERYGDEFLALIEDRPLRLPQLVDIVAGAIDAWLSADVRRATMPAQAAPTRGGSMLLKSLMVCEPNPRISTRDALIGAFVMVAVTALLAAAGVAAKRAGWMATSEVVLGLSFPGSLVLSMPFWMTKGQPWKAQAVFVAAPLTILVAIGYLAIA